MKRARVKANYARSQYSSKPNMVDGYILTMEGGETKKFSTRETAIQYAQEHGYKVWGSQFV